MIKNTLSFIFVIILIFNSFSQGNGLMYCLSSYSPTGLCLSTVNPLSGAINQISTTGLPNGTSGLALSTIDPINGKYYFVYPNSINGVDLNNGTLISSSPLNGSVGYMQFNIADTSIYCLSNQLQV